MCAARTLSVSIRLINRLRLFIGVTESEGIDWSRPLIAREREESLASQIRLPI